MSPIRTHLDSAFDEVERRIGEQKKRTYRAQVARGLNRDLPGGPLRELWRRSNLILVISVMIILTFVPILGLFDVATPIRLASTGGEPSSGAKPDSMASVRMVGDEKPTQRKDPILELILRIQRGEFERPEDVAAGLFLREFDVLQPRLLDLDPSGIRSHRRGVSWTEVEGDFRQPAEPWQTRRSGLFRIRLVRLDGWKVEDLRIVDPALAAAR